MSINLQKDLVSATKETLREVCQFYTTSGFCILSGYRDISVKMIARDILQYLKKKGYTCSSDVEKNPLNNEVYCLGVEVGDPGDNLSYIISISNVYDDNNSSGKVCGFIVKQGRLVPSDSNEFLD